MRVVAIGLVCLLSMLAACSGSRSEQLGCESAVDCEDGQRCVENACVSTGSNSSTVEGRARAEGVDARIETELVGDQQCEQGAETVCTLKPGSKVIWRAPLVEGYRFVEWTGGRGCAGSEPTLEISLSTDVECVARYVKRWRVIGTLADGQGEVRVVSESAFASCSGNVCEVDQDAEVTLNAPARDGFRLASWEGDGCVADTRALITIRPRGDVECRARYIESLTVRGSAVGTEAAIVASSESTSAVCDQALCGIDPGAAVTLSAPVVDGYRFAGWSGDERCSSTESALRIDDVRTNVSCTASYVARFTVTGESEGASPAPPLTATSADAFARCEGARCEVDEGGAVTLSAPSVPGMRLKEWLGEGCVASTGASATASDVRQSRSCTAQYVEGVAVIGSVVGADATVEATSMSAGAACTPGRCIIDIGGSVTLTAPALTGRSFLGWSGDEGCSGSERALTLTDVRTSTTCDARFAARFDVNGTAAPSDGGSVVASSTVAGALCRNDVCNVDEGSTVTLTATASDGHRFTGFSGGGSCTGSAAALTLRDVRNNVSCSANFVQRLQVTGEVSPAAAGSVVASSLATAASCSGSACTVDARSDVALLASPSAGYRFTRWTGCGDGALNPLLVDNVLAAQRCTASFERITYVVSANASAGGSVSGQLGASACANASCTVPHGESVSFRAAPSAGYMFSGWSGCSDSVDAAITLPGVTSMQMCRATFTRLRVSVTAVADPGGSVSASADGLQCTGARCTVDYGGSVSVSAQADTGYTFAGWSDCAVSETATLTLDGVTESMRCRATFSRMTFVVRATAGAGGSVSASSGGVACANATCNVAYGESATLVATPSTGYRFGGWNDCVLSGSPTLQLDAITDARTCSASFERVLLSVTGQVAPGGGGGVTCEGGCTVSYGMPFTLTATPDANMEVDTWSCSPVVAGAGRTLAIDSVTASTQCVVSFRRVGYSVRVLSENGHTPRASYRGVPCTDAVCNGVAAGDSVEVSVSVAGGLRAGGDMLLRWANCSIGTRTLLRSNDVNEAVFYGDATDVQGDMTCTAQFDRSAEVELTATPAAYGDVDIQFSGPGFCTDESPDHQRCWIRQGLELTPVAEPGLNRYFEGYQCNGQSGSDYTDLNRTLQAGELFTCNAIFSTIPI